MSYAIQIDSTGRIEHSTFSKHVTHANADRYILVDTIPKGNLPDYLYVDGKYVYDPLPRPEPVEPPAEESVWDQLDAAYQEGVDSV